MRFAVAGLGCLIAGCFVACSDDPQAPPAGVASAGGASGGAPAVVGISGGAPAGGASAGGASAGGASAGGALMGAGGMLLGDGGAPGSGGASGGMGGMAMGAGGVEMPMGSGGDVGVGGTPGSGGAVVDPNDEFAEARQVCVDKINEYRATVGKAPLRRGTPEQEQCSDQGAQSDGTTMVPHGSFGQCAGVAYGQNTCPGYPGEVTTSLQGCLQQMWNEGEPPQGVDACIADRTGCFQQHGHWINMQNSSFGVVACGFYRMPNGRVWMNQNFGP